MSIINTINIGGHKTLTLGDGETYVDDNFVFTGTAGVLAGGGDGAYTQNTTLASDDTITQSGGSNEIYINADAYDGFYASGLINNEGTISVTGGTLTVEGSYGGNLGNEGTIGNSQAGVSPNGHSVYEFGLGDQVFADRAGRI